MIGGFQSDLSITCMIDRNFGNISTGILFSKVVTWKAGRRCVAWALNIFFLNLNDDPDAVLSTDLGEQRCFKFLIRQLLSLKEKVTPKGILFLSSPIKSLY